MCVFGFSGKKYRDFFAVGSWWLLVLLMVRFLISQNIQSIIKVTFRSIIAIQRKKYQINHCHLLYRSNFDSFSINLLFHEFPPLFFLWTELFQLDSYNRTFSAEQIWYSSWTYLVFQLYCSAWSNVYFPPHSNSHSNSSFSPQSNSNHWITLMTFLLFTLFSRNKNKHLFSSKLTPPEIMKQLKTGTTWYNPVCFFITLIKFNDSSCNTNSIS